MDWTNRGIAQWRELRMWRVLAVAIVLLAVAIPVHAARFKCAGGDVQCLIAAINESNANGHKNTIWLAPGPYALMDVDNDTDGPNGLPSITSHLTILGAGAEKTSLSPASGAPLFRFMHVALSGHLTLDGLTLAGDGRRDGFFSGGAVFNRGAVHIKRSTIRENATFGFGGGLFNDKGIVDITWSSISENTSTTGGAIYSDSGVVNITASLFADNDAGRGSALRVSGTGNTVHITHSRFTGNSAGPDGGVVYASDPTSSLLVLNSTFDRNSMASAGILVASVKSLVVANCAFTNNRAQSNGAGLSTSSTLALVTNTTFDGNTVTFAGQLGEAITNFGTLVLVNSTVADNTSLGGFWFGGFFGSALFSGPDATTILVNTLVARNATGSTANQDCEGPVISLGNNLIGDPTGCSVVLQWNDLTGDPGLGTLADNGRPGNGHVPLLPSSPAIDAGNNALCPRRDQLGRRRIGPCDIGAITFREKHGWGHDSTDDSPAEQGVADAAQPAPADLLLNLTQAVSTWKSSTRGGADILKQLKLAIDLVVADLAQDGEVESASQLK